jgi:hypothetical protein
VAFIHAFTPHLISHFHQLIGPGTVCGATPVSCLMRSCLQRREPLLFER